MRLFPCKHIGFAVATVLLFLGILLQDQIFVTIGCTGWVLDRLEEK